MTHRKLPRGSARIGRFAAAASPGWPASGVDARVVLDVPTPYELGPTLRPYALGRRDRCFRWQAPATAWRATLTPDGPGTGRYEQRGDTVVVSAWGPGAGWLVEHAADLIGLHDDVSGFDALVAGTPYLAARWRDRSGWRFGRSHAVYEALLPTICGQKVTGIEAKRAWNGLVDRWGQQAPGPPGLRVPPRPERLAELGYAEYHVLGLERRRADVIRAVAAAAERLDALVDGTVEHSERVLRSMPGIGVWSVAEVRRLAFGDADAVSYGDYHLPTLVSYSLLGQRDGSDELLAELVAPFAPHRGRVVRLLELTGRMPERRGPRLAPNGMRSR